MPPMRTWFGGPDGGRGDRDLPRRLSAERGLALAARSRAAPTASRRSPSTPGTTPSRCYLPFALNVLSLRGDKICDVTAFISRTGENPDPEVLARMPEQAFDPRALAAAFGKFGLPERLD